MCIAKRVDKLTNLQAALLGNHHCEQCIRGNIEWHAKKDIATALVELARQFTLCDEELKHCVARWQSHLAHIGNIPCRDNHAARRWVLLNGLDNLLNLVYRLAIGLRPAAPLVAIDMIQVAKLIAIDGRLYTQSTEEGIHIYG